MMINQISRQGRREDTKSEEKNQRQISQSQDLQEYEKFRHEHSDAAFSAEQVGDSQWKKHQIFINQNHLSADSPEWKKEKDPDIFFSIIQTQFYGLQYTYQVILGPFRLKILVLNLLRESDAGEDDLNAEELGSGSYGTVREIKLKHGKSYATKKIPFHFKLSPEEGFDYEESKNEQMHMRRCLKQFCFYKIFSLVGIGPKIVREGYDLICFNNCIEFKMELCLPITHDFVFKDIGVSLQSCSADLFWKLSRLHSMKMVHRDIKPENILYSQGSMQFVFGDFGMVALLGEQYWEKTLTKFVGTPNFCGEEMKPLLEGGSGHVNLYLNDFSSLKQTLNYFTSNFISQNSRISSNSMSYNQYQQSFFGSGSFGPESGSISEDIVITDRSPAQTLNSLATLPTTNTLAPKKHASLVNHFESKVIFGICREMERKVTVPKEVIAESINKLYEQHENQEVLTNLYLEINDLFQFQEKKGAVQPLIREWKNSCRHYGPEHEGTLKYLEAVMGSVDQSARAGINRIRQKIIKVKKLLKPDIMEMQMYRHVKNFKQFAYAFLGYMSHFCLFRDVASSDANQTAYISKNYILCIYAIHSSSFLAQQLTNLLFRYFKIPPQHPSDITLKAMKALDVCVSFLKESGKLELRYRISYLFILCQDDNSLGFSSTFLNEIREIMKTISNQQDSDIAALMDLVTRFSPSMLISSPVAEAQLFIRDNLALIEGVIRNKRENKDETKVHVFRYFKAYLLYLQKSDDAYAIEECKLALASLAYKGQHLSSQDIIIKEFLLGLLGVLEFYQNHYKEAYEWFCASLLLINQNYRSSLQPRTVYNLLNNMMATLYKQKKYDEAISSAWGVIQYLQKSNMQGSQQKIVLTLQNCIRFIIQKEDSDISEQGRGQIKNYLERIVQHFYLSFKDRPLLWIKYSIYYSNLIPIDDYKDKQKLIFVHEYSVEAIRSDRRYLDLLHFQYAGCNYQVAKHYISNEHQQLKGMRYLWNCIKTKLMWFNPLALREIDYQIMHIYAQCMVNNQSNRGAIRFLNKIIKYIPEQFIECKIKCCELLFKAYERVGGQKEKIFYELTKNRSKKIRERNFTSVVRCIAKTIHEKKMIDRQLRKIFQYNQLQESGGTMLDKC